MKVLVSSTVVIWALKPQELSPLRTEPSHVSLHDRALSLCSGATLRFCAHQVLEARWWACVLVWAHGEVEPRVHPEFEPPLWSAQIPETLVRSS
jgi:hypothetical protein